MRLIICVMMLLMAGCKDDDLYGINSDTRAFLLVNKKWQTSAIFVKSPQGVVIRDEYVLLDDYKKDDYLLFRADSTFEINDNGVKDPAAPSQVLALGTWGFAMGEQYLKLIRADLPSNLDSIRISDITENILTLERPVPDGLALYSYKAIP